MPTSRERFNNAIAAANANGTTINHRVLSALGSKCVPCPTCNGAGLSPNVVFGERIEYCKTCNGRGYVSVATPNKIAHDFGLSTRVQHGR